MDGEFDHPPPAKPFLPRLVAASAAGSTVVAVVDAKPPCSSRTTPGAREGIRLRAAAGPRRPPSAARTPTTSSTRRATACSCRPTEPASGARSRPSSRISRRWPGPSEPERGQTEVLSLMLYRRNSPRATITALPPTSTRSMASGAPSTRAWSFEGRPISAPGRSRSPGPPGHARGGRDGRRGGPAQSPSRGPPGRRPRGEHPRLPARPRAGERVDPEHRGQFREPVPHPAVAGKPLPASPGRRTRA